MTETTRMTPNGEVAIPHAIREKLNLKTGDRFEVVAREGEIVLRRVDALPTAKELEQFLAATKKMGTGSKVIDEPFGKKRPE